MTGAKLKLAFLIIASFLLGDTGNINHHYQQGLEAYRNNRFDLAIQEFEAILNNSFEAPELYYNLGNAFFRVGNIGGAVWAFENCLRIGPAYENAKYNLKLVNLKVKDKVDLPPPPVYLKWYLTVKEYFTPSGWVSFSTLLILFTAVLFAARKFTAFELLRKINSVILSLFFVALFIALHSNWTHSQIKEGVIYETKVDARSEPNSFSTRLFEIHEGLKVAIKQVADQWVEIELLDGKTGWVEDYQIRLIH